MEEIRLHIEKYEQYDSMVDDKIIDMEGKVECLYN